MARIDEVKAACARLAGMGWQSLLKQHGLDIVKADLAAELARELTIDRSVPGFEDFTLAGKRGIEPGLPAASLLYHAFASPDVHPVNRQHRSTFIRHWLNSIPSRTTFMACAHSTLPAQTRSSSECLPTNTGQGRAEGE